MKQKFVIVIPARMESSRFPGKPLKKIKGMAMVIHCAKRAQLSSPDAEVLIATCNDEIMDEAKKYGIPCVMTSNTHVRCTDRIVEAVSKLSYDPEYVVLVQGDEPMVHPDMIQEALAPLLKDKTIGCTNLIAKITDDADFKNPNTIKIVKDLSGKALYMSREPIPTAHLDKKTTASRFKQVCVMGFRTEVLNRFSDLSPTPLEILESIDMNRMIEHGMPVHTVLTNHETLAVDTPADLEKVEAVIGNDPILKKYLK